MPKPRPSLGVSRSDNDLIDHQAKEVVEVDDDQQVGNEEEEQSVTGSDEVVGVDVDQQEGNKDEEIHSSLDSSLETVFGPGATLLARELESNSDIKGKGLK